MGGALRAFNSTNAFGYSDMSQMAPSRSCHLTGSSA